MERGVYIPIRNPYITGKMTIPNIRRLEPYGWYGYRKVGD